MVVVRAAGTRDGEGGLDDGGATRANLTAAGGETVQTPGRATTTQQTGTPDSSTHEASRAFVDTRASRIFLADVVKEGCATRPGSNIIITTEVAASHVSTTGGSRTGLVMELYSVRAKRSLPQRRLHNVALPRSSDQARRRRRGGYGLYARRRSEDSALSTMTRALKAHG
ncbi:hypothetical protein VTN00DRAFT_10163 [Thermoascus crustaceus]|uniref:uncharacterized protein n=1 Tax=Thermoascus crustaceus TaxID=5088 RepID=UPI0037443D78